MVNEMKIHLSEYNPDWTMQFRLHEERLKKALNDPSIKIEHIGSTSVEGLSAKPVIDILIGVSSIEELSRVVVALEDSPYIYKKVYNDALPFRRFFIGVKNEYLQLYPTVIEKEEVNIPHNHRTAHIHTVPVTHQWWEDHLLFRDHLREHPEDRLMYEAVKQDLSKKDWKTGNEYADSKTECVLQILNKAKRNHTK
ncbi:GrpB family protein [Peribacillus frigoritolerans]|uniref:GrpB family protein n=1 Tax=Peribacillus frigoritolerans TaxID=450367 RepID=UPI0014042D3D|nr:GrpB family protein [Peribacillus frigoritolerans]